MAERAIRGLHGPGRWRAPVHFALSLALVACASVPNDPAPSAPGIVGSWVLDAAASDDPQTQIAALRFKQARRRQLDAMGPDRVARRSNAETGQVREREQRPPVVVRLMLERIGFQVPEAATLDISVEEDGLLALWGEDARRYDGSASSVSFLGGLAERVAGWRGAEFVVLTDGDDGEMEERFTLREGGRVLVHSLRIEHDTFKRDVVIVRRFTRAAADPG